MAWCDDMLLIRTEYLTAVCGIMLCCKGTVDVASIVSMHVCMHVCMYVSSVEACTHVCMHACMYECVCVCMRVCVCVSRGLYACRNVCMYACMHSCGHGRAVGMLVCKCMHYVLF